MSNEENQIEDLKRQFRNSDNTELQKSVLDSLITYRDKGIGAIMELINGIRVEDEVKFYGLDVLKNFKHSRGF